MPDDGSHRDARPVPDVSVVLVGWNGTELLRASLASLQAHSSPDLELIVVDNASTDGLSDAIAKEFSDVRLIRNSENVGFARACNQGMAISRGRYVLLLNSDTYVVDDVLGRAAAELDRRPDVGMLGCELRYPDGRRQHSANRELGLRQSVLERFWLYKLLPASERAEALLGGHWDEDREIEVGWLAGAFLFLRRELFERSGGFDERFFMYGEDSEWCMRLKRHGFKIVYAPKLGVVYHYGAASSDLAWSDLERLTRCYAGGLGAYAALNGHRQAQAFRLVELAGAAFRWAVYRLIARFRDLPYYRQQAAFYGWLARFYLDTGP